MKLSLYGGDRLTEYYYDASLSQIRSRGNMMIAFVIIANNVTIAAVNGGNNSWNEPLKAISLLHRSV